jgi:hypothetical protein
MKPAKIIKSIILKLNKIKSRSKSALYLSISSDLSDLQWDDGNFKNLIETFLKYLLKISHPSRHVLIAVHEIKQKRDLEDFFSVHPKCWLNLRFECQAENGFESGAKTILGNLGFRCSEWIGVEDSSSQLGAFQFGTQDKPALILFVQNRGARRNCDFLIPVTA